VISTMAHLQFSLPLNRFSCIGGEGCRKGFELLSNFLNRIESLKYAGFDLFLVQKTKHRNDMLDVLLIISGPEGRHLKVCPIRQFHLDLLGVLLLVRISRRDVWDWRSIDHISPLTFIVLRHFLGSFDVIPTHYCFQQSRSPQNKMLKAAPRWRLDNPA
jgi:hypothetical protein